MRRLNDCIFLIVIKIEAARGAMLKGFIGERGNCVSEGRTGFTLRCQTDEQMSQLERLYVQAYTRAISAQIEFCTPELIDPQ